MASKGAGRLALGLATRAGVIASLACVAIELLIRTELYATVLVVAGLAALATMDLAAAVGRTDRALAQFVDGLAAEAYEPPARLPAGLAGFAQAAAGAVAKLTAARAARQRQIDYRQGLIDTVSAVLVVLQPDGTITLANRAAQKLAGRPASRLGDIPAIGAAAAERIEALPLGMRTIVHLADGRAMLAQAAEFRPTGGERGRLISLQSINGELDVVEQKAWRDLVRILSHEMMNSLTPIVSLSESLAARASAPGRTKADPEAAEALEVIARRSAGLMDFVDRYRTIAELPRPERRPVALSALAADVERLMSATVASRGVRCEVLVEPPDLTVAADRELLEQAVINLVKNALDACAEVEAPVMTLSCRQENDQISIAVSDNGVGLDPQHLADIFVPFFTTRPGGSGIGLSLARQIALAHGGQIDVAASRPTGTRFRMILPAR